jgi:drug/metabolite transporter (DMT)-like permease
MLGLFQSREKISLKKKFSCFLIGVFADTLQTTFFFLSIERVGASLAALSLYTFPLFVFLIQRFIFQQLATKIQWISLSISLLGCLLVIHPFQKTSGLSTDWFGIILGLAAGLTYAFYFSFGAHITKGISPISSASYLTGGAFFAFTLIAFSQGELVMPVLASDWMIAVLMILIATIIPLLCLVKGMQRLGAMQTSLLFTIEPVITILLAVLFFGESLTLFEVLGSLCIISSALLIQKKKVPSSVLGKEAIQRTFLN